MSKSEDARQLESLKRRWKKKTSEDMPEHIACLPLHRIERALDFIEAGATVFVPKAPVQKKANEDGCMQMWDTHQEF